MEKKKQKKDSCMLNNSVPQSRAVSTGEFRDLGRDYVKGVRKKKETFHLPLMIQQLIIIISLELNH